MTNLLRVAAIAAMLFLALAYSFSSPADASCDAVGSCDGCAYTRTFCTYACSGPDGCEMMEYDCGGGAFCYKMGCCPSCPPVRPD